MYEGNNKLTGTSCVSTPSVAQEVAKSAASLAERAEALAASLFARLEPVMTCAEPTHSGGAERTEREYPPFFNDLRNQLQHIEKSLSSIEDAISRTAL